MSSLESRTWGLGFVGGWKSGSRKVWACLTRRVGLRDNSTLRVLRSGLEIQGCPDITSCLQFEVLGFVALFWKVLTPFLNCSEPLSGVHYGASGPGGTAKWRQSLISDTMAPICRPNPSFLNVTDRLASGGPTARFPSSP